MKYIILPHVKLNVTYLNNPYQCKLQQYMLVRLICKLCKMFYKRIVDCFSCNIDQIYAHRALNVIQS